MLPSSNRLNEASAKNEVQGKSPVEKVEEPVPVPDDVIELDEDELNQIQSQQKPVSKAASLAGSTSKKSTSMQNPELDMSRKFSIDKNLPDDPKSSDQNLERTTNQFG